MYIRRDDHNMKKDILKGIMMHNLEQAKKLLQRDGYVAPVGFIYYGNKVDIIGLSLKNQEDKEMQILTLGKMARKKKADAVITVIESWYVATDKKDLNIVPSTHPARKECIIAVGECEEGDILMTQLFERSERKNGEKEKDEFIFGEKLEDMDIGFSRFKFGIYKKDKDTDSYRGYA